MPRLPFFVVLVVASFSVWPVPAQPAPSAAPVETPVLTRFEAAPLLSPGGLPAQPLPLRPMANRVVLAESAPETDTLTQKQILRKIADLYSFQSAILVAQVDGDAARTETLLDSAMQDLHLLVEQPSVLEDARFRELYRSIITEYERYYGAPDTALTLPNGDIFKMRSDMFAALNAVDEPLLEDVMLPEMAPMHTTVPMTVNRLVQQSIDFMIRERRQVLHRWITRADTYFPMIEQILQEEGVPDELKYLALVESGLNPRAQSWARAMGMWQFMAATGRAYGLDVTPWVDERRDPEKATRAAAQHLRDLYEMFDDWHLALAAYNCGAGNVRKAIRRTRRYTNRSLDFWGIYAYLPRETRNYVPMFIATSLLISNPQAFDIPESETSGPRYEYDHVPVQGMLSLESLAEMAGTDVSTVRALNPELRRYTLPPTDGAYMLRLPLGTYARFAEAYAALPESAKRPSSEYVVQRGDALSRIAHRYGVSVRALMQANGLSRTTIRVGQRLVVPVPRYSGASLADAQPVTVQYGSRIVRPIAPLDPVQLAEGSPSTPVVRATTRTATPTPEPKKPKGETRIVYHVRSGDTLSEIAKKYGVSVTSIRQWNNLSSSRIRAGQQLALYDTGRGTITHRVRSGDSLIKIAKQYRVYVSDLRRWNNLSGSRIYAGQTLTIHRGGASSSQPSYILYRVRSGDSLYTIGRKYKVSIQSLRKWNNLRSNTIHPGQRLRIYT